MYKLGVIGDKNQVLAFKAVGLKVFSPELDKDKIRNTIKKMEDDFGLIFITEDYANLIPETINQYKKRIRPALILIPNSQGTLNIGMNEIKKNVEKAVGQDIL